MIKELRDHLKGSVARQYKAGFGVPESVRQALCYYAAVGKYLFFMDYISTRQFDEAHKFADQLVKEIVNENNNRRS